MLEQRGSVRASESRVHEKQTSNADARWFTVVLHREYEVTCVCTNLRVCVCVCCNCLFPIFVALILNSHVIIGHAIQTNRGSAHTYGSLLKSGSNRHRRPATQHQTVTKATENFGPPMPEHRETLRFAWMAWPYYFVPPGADEASVPVLLSQFLRGLRLLLGDLLLWHDGHPRRDRTSDGLLGDVVVVDEGEEAAAPPGALRQVAAVHPDRHAPTLLLQGETDKSVSESWPYGNLL